MPTRRRRPGNARGDLSDDIPPLTTALTEAIRYAHAEDGAWSYKKLRELSEQAGRTILTAATLSRMLTPDPNSKDQRSLPNWVYYETLLRILGKDPAEYKHQWDAAQEEWKNRPAPCALQQDAHDDDSEPTVTPWWRRKWFIAGAPVAAVGAVAIVLSLTSGSADPPAGPSGQPDKRMDNTDPRDKGCSPQMDEQKYYSHLYRDWPTNTDAAMTNTLITMHYSPKCRTTWAVLDNAPPGTQAVLHRNSDGTELRCTADSNGSCMTKQLSDRGTTTHAFARAGDAYGQTKKV
jgi:hypothetical protein